jgi:radical SAM superfamily enzyme YgiQ (UPF0313 family)
MSAEVGAVVKNPGGKLNIALVYPNSYFVGMSNLGMQTMYHEFNRPDGICCERFFTDRPRSVESGRRLSDFNLVAFSVSYELDWLNVIQILDANKIPLKTAERGGAPIVAAGGPAVTMNPEPMAELLDIAFLGDGEGLGAEILAAFEEARDYDGFLDRLEGKPGVYIPARLEPLYSGGVLQGFRGGPIRPRCVKTLNDPAQSRLFTRDTSFGDMFLLEIARGCAFNCRFCTARGIYDPFRPVRLEHLEAALDRAQASGLKLGLITAALNSHRSRGLKIAPPSLRAGLIKDELLELLAFSGVAGITLAPECGDEGLRLRTGKRIPDETFFNDIARLVESGIRDVKLYFMIGLPEETPEQCAAIVDFTRAASARFVAASRPHGRIGRLGVSVNVAVPKPATLNERSALLDSREVKRRVEALRTGLKPIANLDVGFESPRSAALQTLIARGDRRLCDTLIALARGAGLNAATKDRPAFGEPLTGEILPWSFIERGGGA